MRSCVNVAIMNEPIEDRFFNLCSGSLNKCEDNEYKHDFIDYFNKHYSNRPGKYAMSYRDYFYGDVNTTGHVESFHNRLKKVYIKRKCNKRLDDLIVILFKLEWDDHCPQIREKIGRYCN